MPGKIHLDLWIQTGVIGGYITNLVSRNQRGSGAVQNGCGTMFLASKRGTTQLQLMQMEIVLRPRKLFHPWWRKMLQPSQGTGLLN